MPPAGYTLPPRPPPVAPSGAPLAEFGERLLAFVIDAVILAAASLVVWIPAMIIWLSLFFGNFETAPDGSLVGEPDPVSLFLSFVAIFGVMFLLIVAIQYVYRVELMFRTGQTIGKRVMKLRVVPLDPTATLTRQTAAIRFLIGIAAGLVPFGNLVDGLWQLWDQPFRQCLHDKVARTVVVKA